MTGLRILALAAILAIAAGAARPAVADGSRRVRYGPFSLVVPGGWSERPVPEDWSPSRRYGQESPVAQISSAPFAGFDSGRLQPGQVIVFAYQLGRWGSRGLTTLRAADFVSVPGPGGIRAAQAGGFRCVAGGRCFSLGVLVARRAPSAADVQVANRIIASLRAAPA